MVGTFFSFADDGQPVWYLIDGSWSGDSGKSAIAEYRYVIQAPIWRLRFARFPDASLTLRQCDSNVRYSGGARPGAASLYDFRFAIGGEALRWCLELIVPATTAPESALLSAAGFRQRRQRWGLIGGFGEAGATAPFTRLYVYDAEGKPRWAYASDQSRYRLCAPQFRFAAAIAAASQPANNGWQTPDLVSLQLVTPRV